MQTVQAYDVCVISFSDLRSDARTQNLIITAAEMNLKVSAISLNNINETGSAIGRASFYPVTPAIFPDSKTYWRYFHKSAVNIAKDITARKWWAADLYSLSVAIALKKRHGGEVIYDSREIYSALGPLASNPLKQRVISWIEKYLVRKVSAFVVSGEADATYLKSHFKTNKPFHLVMNLPNYTERIESNIFKETFPELENKIICVYQGAVLKGRGIEPTLNAMREESDIALVILGNGPDLAYYQKLAEEFRVADRTRFMGMINYTDLHKYTSAADVGICFIEPISFSYQLALPNKLFEYIMARVPVLASNLPAMDPIISTYRIGVSLPTDASSAELAATIIELHSKKTYFSSECDNAAKMLNYDANISVIKGILE